MTKQDSVIFEMERMPFADIPEKLHELQEQAEDSYRSGNMVGYQRAQLQIWTLSDRVRSGQ